MALIKMSSIGITNLSGKAGGSVYAHNRGGAYVRNFAVPSNPQTQAQSAARAAFGAFASAWRTLSQEVRDGWKAAAENFPYIDRFGDSKIMSGENLYISLNRNLELVGESALAEPPVSQGASGGVISSAVGLSVLAGEIDFTGALELIGEIDPTSMKVAVYATPAVSPGISYLKNRFRFLNWLEGLATVQLSEIASTDYSNVFGVPMVGAKVGFRFDIINTATGERSASVFTSAIVTQGA